MRRLLVDTTPLRVSAHYRRLWLGLSLANVGSQLAVVAVGLQVYDLTGSTFSVGLVGAFALVPLVALGLYGGSLVDAHDRRSVAMLASAALWLVAVAMAVQAWAGLGSVGLLYLLVALQSAAYAVNSAARTAITPRLLPAELLPAANALQTASYSVGFSVGPLLGGVLVGSVGFGAAYAVDALTLGVAMVTLYRLPALPPSGAVRRAGIASVLEGLRYLRSRPNVRMTFLVDLAAMVLSQPRALFPAVGAVVVGGGATTVGVLSSAVAVGSVLAGVLSGPLGLVRRQALVICWAIVAWGASVTAFGVVLALAPPLAGGSAAGAGDAGATWTLWPAAACLAAAGASDAVSAVFRTTILQAATPDEMRGRLQGVFIVVVAGGPRLGDVVVGAAAAAATAALAPASRGLLPGEAVAAALGGVATIVVLGVLVRAQPRFLRYDARDPQP